MIAGREQGFEQHITVLIGGVGIAQAPLLLEQVKSRPLAPPAPERTVALVARSTSAHMAELEAMAKVISSVHRHKSK